MNPEEACDMIQEAQRDYTNNNVFAVVIGLRGLRVNKPRDTLNYMTSSRLLANNTNPEVQELSRKHQLKVSQQLTHTHIRMPYCKFSTKNKTK